MEVSVYKGRVVKQPGDLLVMKSAAIVSVDENKNTR
jgi:hypothetical protein